MRKLSITHDGMKFLDRLDAKQYRQVVRKIFTLANNPEPQDSIHMEGSTYRRTDQGEFRIVYHFDDETVFIVVIGKRNDDEVYRKVERKR